MNSLKFALLALLFASQVIIAQQPEPDFTRIWYLTSVAIDGETFVPSEYGYYPDVTFFSDNDAFNISLATPGSVFCSTELENFQENPNRFTIVQDWLCLLTQMCTDNPETGPCSTIYGKHAQLYFATEMPFIYEVSTDEDDLLQLQVTNSEGNTAIYSEKLLATDDLSTNSISIFPNPVVSTLQIEAKEVQINQIMIRDISGQIIEAIFKNTDFIDVSGISTGIYFLEFKTANGSLVKQFLKQ